jgi:hypothetical protein
MLRQPPPKVFSPWRMIYTVDPPALAAKLQRGSQSIVRLRGDQARQRGEPLK